MQTRRLLTIILGFFAATLHAQLLLEEIPDSAMGRPLRPPLMSMMGLFATGSKMANDRSAGLSGPIDAVTFEEIRMKQDGTVSQEISSSVTIHFDEKERPIEEVQNGSNSDTTIVYKYEGSLLVSQVVTFNIHGKIRPNAWTYWTYDKAGKLIEFRRGRGEELENHYVNFKRDDKGRLLSFEYHQGAKDGLQSRTVYKYSADGKTVDETDYDASGSTVRSIGETIDDQGRVSRVAITERGWRTTPPRTIRTAFRYDAQGRPIEQLTDPYAIEKEGGEQEIPPGKVSLTYDDTKHTRTVFYSSEEGALSSTAQYDAKGLTVGETFGVSPGSMSSMSLDCTHDAHGNWTACRRWVERAGVRKMNAFWRRTIVYRQ